MSRRFVLITGLLLAGAVSGFGQASALRDYVGSISIAYHPDVAAYMGKFREAFQKRGYPEAAKSIDNYLKGLRGSGFVYVDDQGTNYVITNHHVIRQSDALSISFEKQDGTRTRYEGLKVVMADEDTDIALLVFTGKPFTRGLDFNALPLDDGDDVFAAGFPGLGATALWQFSRGTISNVSARLPKGDEGETIGPFIQHTAPIDPGNSGGPLLVLREGALTGYAVAGINTLSALGHQAANYAIPMEAVGNFLNVALGKTPVNDRELLDGRINSFMRGLGVPRAVYGHIAAFLTGSCTAQNAEYAISELLEKASPTVVSDINRSFAYNPVDGMNAAVAWLIENSLRPKSGNIRISLDSVKPREGGQEGYTVTFQVNDRLISSNWVKEYDIWRIESFGDAAAGNKSLLSEKEERRRQEKNLRTDVSVQISAGLGYIFDLGPAFTGELIGRTGPAGWGLRAYLGGEYTQVEGLMGLYLPIKMTKAAIIPYGEAGAGVCFRKAEKKKTGGGFYADEEPLLAGMDLTASFQGGLQFTTAAIPGLYLKTAYQFNASFSGHRSHVLIAGLGYAF
jgi:serine protease Do